MKQWKSLQVFAIGHSTLEQEELIARLQAHGVGTLLDIRTVPRSRTNPQFNRDVLAKALPRYSLGYRHVAELGGLRKTIGEASPNKAWRNMSFRGYADYMLTSGFEEGLAILREEASVTPVAIMCAEGMRWRCHRSLVADALFARGCVVLHIESMWRERAHSPPAHARVRAGRVTYPDLS